MCKFIHISKTSMQISILYRAKLTSFNWEDTLEGYISAAIAVTWLQYPRDLNKFTSFYVPTLPLRIEFYE